MGIFSSIPIQPQPVVIQQGTIPGQTTVIYGAPTYGYGYPYGSYGYGYGSDLALVGDIIIADVASDIIVDSLYFGGKDKSIKKKNKNKKKNTK